MKSVVIWQYGDVAMFRYLDVAMFCMNAVRALNPDSVSRNVWLLDVYCYKDV